LWLLLPPALPGFAAAHAITCINEVFTVLGSLAACADHLSIAVPAADVCVRSGMIKSSQMMLIVTAATAAEHVAATQCTLDLLIVISTAAQSQQQQQQ
jgi:hypothetical protein